MNLEPRNRIAPGSRHAAFEVAGPRWETRRHTYLSARQVFWNYRDEDRSLYEAPEDEWHDVLVRLSRQDSDPESAPKLPDADFEREHVLSLPGSPWFLTPIDLVPAAGIAEESPLLILADPHAELLSGVLESTPAGHAFRLARELLLLLDDLHHVQLVCGRLEVDDFVIDPCGRWWFLGTDKIARAGGEDSIAADLAHWAELVQPILERSGENCRAGGDDLAAADQAWLAERLERVARGAQSAGELLAESRRAWPGIGHVLRRLRRG